MQKPALTRAGFFKVRGQGKESKWLLGHDANPCDIGADQVFTNTLLT
ncbi:hypothetical protein RUA4292_03421 [Ruegeria atlantica]|uniref:Uncharacterized protein n=1 Tax=Ruegeria atlantica TaxID=81569 RepID=A0A0P1EGD4_9RHOB|nr:hypothetical protein RUA4292_03421 [Ruegeria atlantica]